MIIKLLRDNYYLNKAIRSVVLMLVKFSKRAHWLARKYRVFGIADIIKENVRFKIYAESDDFIANDLYYGLDYESDEFKLIKALTDRAKFFIDVGSNTGIFSIFSALANPEIQVISLEPHPGNYQRLLKNVSLNNTGRIDCRQVAVGDTAKQINFTLPADGSLSTTSSANDGFARHFHPIPFTTIRVDQSTLDIELSTFSISSTDLIKIDVEYYEYEVLLGAVKILSVAKPLILLEVLDYDKLVLQFPNMRGKIQRNIAEQIERLMFSYGYFAYQLHSNGIQQILTTTGPHAKRNFLFAPVKSSGGVLPYRDLTNIFSSSR